MAPVEAPTSRKANAAAGPAEHASAWAHSAAMTSHGLDGAGRVPADGRRAAVRRQGATGMADGSAPRSCSPAEWQGSTVVATSSRAAAERADASPRISRGSGDARAGWQVRRDESDDEDSDGLSGAVSGEAAAAESRQGGGRARCGTRAARRSQGATSAAGPSRRGSSGLQHDADTSGSLLPRVASNGADARHGPHSVDTATPAGRAEADAAEADAAEAVPRSASAAGVRPSGRGQHAPDTVHAAPDDAPAAEADADGGSGRPRRLLLVNTRQPRRSAEAAAAAPDAVGDAETDTTWEQCVPPAPPVGAGFVCLQR